MKRPVKLTVLAAEDIKAGQIVVIMDVGAVVLREGMSAAGHLKAQAVDSTARWTHGHFVEVDHL